MNSIRDGVTALDTNEFIFGLRDTPDYPACRRLLFESLPGLTIYMPLQIMIDSVRRFGRALRTRQLNVFERNRAKLLLGSLNLVNDYISRVRAFLIAVAQSVQCVRHKRHLARHQNQR